jgi:tetratricopeptide (TPR) repeat protein
VDYLHQAGLKAASRSALGDARAFLEQALEILDGLPESQATLERAFELRLVLRPIVGLLGGGRGVLEVLRYAEKIAVRLNDDERLGRVSAFIANALLLVGELDEALEVGTRALNIAQRESNVRLRILGSGFLAFVHRDMGDLERAVAMGKETLALLPPDWRHDFLGMTAPTYVYNLHHLVFALSLLGRFSEAAEYALEATRVADSLGNPTAITMVSHAAGFLHSAKGEWREARRCYERAVNVSQSGGILSALPAWLAGLATSLARLGEVAEASARVRDGERSLDHLAANANVVLHAGTYIGLGRACLQLGWTDEALRLGQRAVECSRKQPGHAAAALHLLGDVASKCDPFDSERAEELYRSALSLAEPRAMRPLVAHCHGSLASLFGRMRKRQAARDHLSTATTLFREMGMQFWLEQAEMQMRVLR